MHGFIVPTRVIGVLILLSGVLPCVAGIWLYTKTSSFLEIATPTQGTVVELRPGDSVEGNRTYRAVFQIHRCDGTGAHNSVAGIK